jgi:hypothetical protein
MFIESVMAICDRILRRAAEQNPGTLCLQKVSSASKQKDTKTTKGAN